jgi:hypothetical protein
VTPGFGAIWIPIRAAIRQIGFRRQVKLTVEHKRLVAFRALSSFTGTRKHMKDVYVVTVTNKSLRRDIVVNRVWFDTTPNVEIQSRDLPVRIEPEGSWSGEIPVDTVPGTPAEVQRLGRCELSPDNKIIESRSGR